MQIQPTEDQVQALDAICACLTTGQKEITFVGPAGSGKTTVTRLLLTALSDLGWDAMLVAPTNRARLRMSQQTGRAASTLASLLYSRFVETDTGDLLCLDPRQIIDDGDSRRVVLIIDEASMVGSRTFAELRDKNPDIPVIFIGDSAQLPPVKDTCAAKLQSPDAALTRIHRQAEGNPIIGLATAIRTTGSGTAWLKAWYPQQTPKSDVFYTASSLDWAVTAYVAAVTKGLDVQVLAYTHAMRKEFNARAMRARTPDNLRVFPPSAGVRVVATCNLRDEGVVNGEIYTMEIVHARPTVLDCVLHSGTGEDVRTTPPIRTFPSMMWEQPYEEQKKWKERVGLRGRVPTFRLGHCLTIHQSQGSQWDVIILLLDHDIATKPQLFYTAVTRAAKRLIIVDIC